MNEWKFVEFNPLTQGGVEKKKQISILNAEIEEKIIWKKDNWYENKVGDSFITLIYIFDIYFLILIVEVENPDTR